MRLRLGIAPAVAATLLFLCGCATQPPAGDPDALADYRARHDPIEPLNRKFYAINSVLDQNLLRPVAVGYHEAFPDKVRDHVHDVLSNLGNPAQLANDILEGNSRKAGNTLMRLLINSTIGVGGIFDLATKWGWPDHDNDFGLTLAVWGVPDGPCLYLPVLGPNNIRDAIGYGVNTAFDPLTWVSFAGSTIFGWTRFGVGAVVSRERVLNETDAIQQTALDPYATYRSLYQQSRASAVAAARVDLPATVPDWFPRPSGH
jgi:phospholipid-binding lipoprotein MlaA